MTLLLAGWLSALNLLALLTMAWDKTAARRGNRRIPERRLLLLAWLGGSVGLLGGIWLFRHKTLHLRFTLGVPAILLLQLVLGALLHRLGLF